METFVQDFKVIWRIEKHARDKLCYIENEEYYLNSCPEKGKTDGTVYYKQKVDGRIVKTEITLEQWKKLYCFNKQNYRKNLKNYDDRYFSRFPNYEDENGDEEDPMEYQADYETRFIESDICERLDIERLKKGFTKEQRKLYRCFFELNLSQEEIAKRVHIEQFQVSRKLKELGRIVALEKLDDGTRDKAELQAEYSFNRYCSTGKLKNHEDVIMICTPKVRQTFGGAYFYGKKRTNIQEYSPDFKLSVILDMRNNHLSYAETVRKYVEHKIKSNVLQIVQTTNKIQTNTTFEKYHDCNTLRISTNIKNISNQAVILNTVSAFVLNGFGNRDTDKLYYTRFYNKRYAECQPIT